MSRLAIVLALVGVAQTGFMLELVHRRQLREKYALLWLAVGIGILMLAVSRRAVDALSVFLGIAYGTTTLFFAAICFLLLVVAHLTWEVSRLEDRSRRLAEEIALLRARAETADPTPIPERDA